MKIVALTQFGTLDTPLRNVRFGVDGTSMFAELIVEQVIRKPRLVFNLGESTAQNVLHGGYPVVEGDRLLRLEFEYILAIAADTDIDVDLFGGLHEAWSDAPRLHSTKAFYPFLEIVDSPWKKQLPEHRGKDDPDIRHFRIISAECSVDLLATAPSGAWQENSKN